MRKVASLLLTATCGFAALGTLGCNGEGDLHETDSGGVIIVVSDFNGRPNAVSVSSTDNIVVIDNITLQSNVANPNEFTPMDGVHDVTSIVYVATAPHPFAAAAPMVTVYRPAAVAVPDSAPVDASIASPGGRRPAVTE